MIRLIAYIIVLTSATCSAFGMSDAVSTTETKETESGYTETVTTYERDGKKVLVDYEVTGNDRHLWSQSIFFDDDRVARILTINGETSYMIDPNVPVEVVFRYSDDGNLATVGLGHEDIGAVEGFTVEDGRLTPMKGEDIVSYRELSSAIHDALGAMRENRKHNKSP